MSRALAPSLLLLLGPLATQVAAQSIMPFLPKDTIVVASMPDIDASAADFAASPLAKMWKEKEVQDFLQGVTELATQQIQKALEQAKAMHEAGKLPIDPAQLTALRVHGLTVAATKLALNVGDFGPMPEVGIIAQLDLGAAAEQWFQLVRVGLGLLEQRGEIAREDAKIGDADFICLSAKAAPPGMAMGLNIALTGNSIVIGTLRNEVQQTVERMQKGEPELADAPQFKQAFGQMKTEGAEMQVFARIDPLLDFGVSVASVASGMNRRMAKIDPEGVARVIDALGLRSTQSIAAVSRYDGGKAVTETFEVSPAPGRKGLFAGGNKNLDLGFLKWVPKDAVSFYGKTMEPTAIYDAAMAALNAYDEKLGKMVMEHLHQVEEAQGCKLRDDLFGAIGDTVIHWAMPLASFASPPEWVWLIKVNDEQKLVKVLKSLASMSDGAVDLEESEKRGVKTYQIRVKMDPTRGMGMNPLDVLNPSFAFKNGYMVVGFSPSDIRQVFKRMDRADDDPKTDIRGNKEYAACAGALPKELQKVAFTDNKANFESIYQVVSSLLALMPPNEDIPLDMSRLPDSSTLTKHLFGGLSYASTDASGVHGTSVSPFGPEVDTAIAILVVSAVGAVIGARGRF